jgi:amidophosphoribosyltransferase
MVFDKFREECGLIGIWQHPEAANLAYLGLYAQQHRGQEGAGIVALDRASAPATFAVHKGHGLVADVFGGFDFTERLRGKSAIGHVRYTTAGDHRLANVQPLFSETAVGRVAVAHNGNLINAETLRKELIQDGAIFGTSVDTEVIMHLLARAPQNVLREEVLISALRQIQGAYSLLVMFDDRLFAVRDPNGFRPLAIGKLVNGGWAVASETCAFDLIGAEYVRDVEPGEVVEIVSMEEPRSFFPFGRKAVSPCIFEYVYFARPDSSVFARNVYPIRKRMGAELARECSVKADIVVPVPDSGVTAALGYSQEAGVPLELGLIRNHYVGRTFIEPKQSIRDFGVKIKLNANPDIIRDKVVVVIDDSIVRGTTSRKLVAMLRRAGAREVHMRISAPPTTDPCFYGVDTPEKEELIASQKSVEEIGKYIGVDSLLYLSLEGLYRAVQEETGKMCDACFSGNYPVGKPQKEDTRQKELFS